MFASNFHIFNGKKLVRIENLLEKDEKEPEDERTMTDLKDIGNSIFKCVQFTSIDCPSHHPSSRKIPIFYLQVYVSDNKFVHDFYIVIPYRSSYSRKTEKSFFLVEEGLRKLRNHSRGMD